MNAKARSILVVVRQTPYGGSLARSSLEFALSAATFDQNVAVLFLGNGVLQLLPEQSSETIGTRNVAKLLRSFPLFDLDKIYADNTALSRFDLRASELAIAVQPLCLDGIRDLYDQYDHIAGF